MTRKQENSTRRQQERVNVFVDSLVVADGPWRSYHGIYFRSTKYKNLAYHLQKWSAEVHLYQGIKVKKSRNGYEWSWKRIKIDWKRDALLALAWPDWSPDDVG